MNILEEDQTIPKTFSVTSYNVLADMYTDRFYFPYCSEKDLLFQVRSRRIVEEIQSIGSDIVCMQELDHFNDFYQRELELLGYSCLFLPKLGREEGILTLFKRDVFQKVSEKSIHIDSLIPDELNINHFRRGSSCTLLYLVHIQTKQKVLVANTHLFWNPSCEEVKLLQAALILKELSGQDKRQNIILCGDFNSMPTSNVFSLLTAHSEPSLDRIEAQFRDKVRMNDQRFIHNKYKNLFTIKLKSAFDNYEGMGMHPEFTNYTKKSNWFDKFKGTLDYIFYNEQEKGISFNSTKKIPIDQIKKEEGLPSQIYPSDHIPITAIFLINNNEHVDNNSKIDLCTKENEQKQTNETSQQTIPSI